MKQRISATVKEEVAAIVRFIAAAERCSLSNVVGRSIDLLNVVPKELRDLIIELLSDNY